MIEHWFYTNDLVQDFPEQKKKYQIFLKNEQKTYPFNVNCIPMVEIKADSNKLHLNG